MTKHLLVVLLAMSGCATTFESSKPYARERAIGNWNGNWLGDGAPSVLTVYNPLTVPAEVDVECPNELPNGYPDDRYTALVPERGQISVFIQKLNKDQMDNVCRVVGFKQLASR